MWLATYHDGGQVSWPRRIRPVAVPVVVSSCMSDKPPRNAADQNFDWNVSSTFEGIDDSYFKLPKRIAILTWGALAWDPGELPLVSEDPEHMWRLSVLNLATMTETQLAETRSVDDQAAWRDDAKVMYGVSRDARHADVWTVPADGTGVPSVAVTNADSPAKLG